MFWPGEAAMRQSGSDVAAPPSNLANLSRMVDGWLFRSTQPGGPAPLRFRGYPVHGKFRFEVQVLIEPRFEDQILAASAQQGAADALLIERHFPQSRVPANELQLRR